jgi:hypothetical protein
MKRRIIKDFECPLTEMEEDFKIPIPGSQN